MDSPRWLTVRDAAERAGVGTATIQRWIRDGRIGALELGGARTVYRIHTSDLDHLLGLRQPAEAAAKPAEEPSYDAREILESLSILPANHDQVVSGELVKAAAGDLPLELDIQMAVEEVQPLPEGSGPPLESLDSGTLLPSDDPDYQRLWMLPLLQGSVPAQVGEVCRIVRRWLDAELVILQLQETAWRFVEGQEPEGVDEIVEASGREVLAGPRLVISKAFPDDRFGMMVTSRIGGRSGSAGWIAACWRPGSRADEQHARNLRFAAGVASHLVRRRPDRWLDMTDVAGRCQVTEATVRRWIRQDQLPAISLGSLHRVEYRVHVSDLEWFLYQRSRKRSGKHNRPVRS